MTDLTRDPGAEGQARRSGARAAGHGRAGADVRDLLSRARPHRRVLLLSVVLGLLGSAAALAQPLVAKAVIDSLGQPQSLLAPVLLLLGLVLAGAAVLAVQSYLLERTAERVVLTARTGLLRRLLRLRMADLDFHPPGDLLSRVASDTTLLRAVTTSVLVEAVNAVPSLLGAIVVMALLDPVLLAVTLAVFAGLAATLTLLLPRVRRATEGVQQAVAALTEGLARALGAIRTVRASGATARETAAVAEAAARAYREGVSVARYGATAGVSSGLAVQTAFLLVLGLGGLRVAAGALPVSSLIAFLLYLFYLGQPISALVNGATQLQQGLAAVRRIRELEELPAEEDAPADLTPSSPAGESGEAGPVVVFDGVSFRYRGDNAPVLDRVSLVVPARGQTALVGPSGAGKTTVFSLLERFYDPDEGRILLDGEDLTGLPREQVRAALGYVEQDAPVLSGTLRENLVYAAPQAGGDELAEVLRAARLEDFVAGLPEGLDTWVGDRGVTLSGGQRQRVAIARALLRRPRLLLLDEATAQLDAVNERAMREVVEAVAEERAVLVIAHRLSTVVAAQQIVVLDRGRVRAVGRHDELVAGDELYAELAATQLLTAPS